MASTPESIIITLNTEELLLRTAKALAVAWQQGRIAKEGDENPYDGLTTCKHCGHLIQGGTGSSAYYHPSSVGRPGGLGRCQEGMTKYGYNAEPIGQECGDPCLGTVEPDPNERMTD